METIKSIWYQELDWSMIWVCLGAVVVLSFFILINPTKKADTEKGVSNFFINTWKNHVYNLLAGLLMLTFVSEVGFPMLNSYINFDFEFTNGALHFLAALSGLGGGYVIAKIIRLFQKI